jgi:hypothetical protein
MQPLLIRLQAGRVETERIDFLLLDTRVDCDYYRLVEHAAQI